MTPTKSKEEAIPLGGVSRKVGAGYCESLTVDNPRRGGGTAPPAAGQTFQRS